MKKIFVLFTLIVNILLSDTVECTKKNFLINMLKSNSTWYLVDNRENRPFDIMKIDRGMVKIKNKYSDFHPVLLNINVDNFGEVGVYMFNALPKYENKDFILKPYKNDCSLNKIIFEIKAADTYTKYRKIVILKKL